MEEEVKTENVETTETAEVQAVAETTAEREW